MMSVWIGGAIDFERRSVRQAGRERPREQDVNGRR